MDKKEMIPIEECPYHCIEGRIFVNDRFEPCPLHGGIDDVDLSDGVLENGESLYDVLHIPTSYRGEWVDDIDLMFSRNDAISKNCIPASVLQLKNILWTLYNEVGVENHVYLESMFIYANPALIDLNPFIFTLQKMAFENGLSVTPVITLNDLNGLRALQDYSNMPVETDKDVSDISARDKLAGQGADWYKRTKASYTDYLRSSICIVIDNDATSTGAMDAFVGFLTERSLRDLPTYVFSSAFFDMKREGKFYNKTGRPVLNLLTPYLLLGKTNEAKAREHGWLGPKQEALGKKDNTVLKNFNKASYKKDDALKGFDI